MFYGENVRFIAGRDFDTEFGHHEYGEEVPEAPQISNLDVLVSAGFLHPYVPEQGYQYLPAHLYNYLNTKAEVESKLVGDTTPHAAMQNPQYPGGKPEVVKQAEAEAEQQVILREQVRLQHEQMAERRAQQDAKREAAKAAVAKKSAPAKEKR